MALSHRENVVAHLNISVWTFTTLVLDALPQISNPKNGALSLKRLKSHDIQQQKNEKPESVTLFPFLD